VHELSVAQSIVETAVEEAQAHGASRVVGINLQLGRMSGVQREPLEFGFEISSKGTAAEGATLKITEIPLTIRCRSCGAESGVEAWEFICRVCESGDVEILTGRELAIVSLDVE